VVAARLVAGCSSGSSTVWCVWSRAATDTGMTTWPMSGLVAGQPAACQMRQVSATTR